MYTLLVGLASAALPELVVVGVHDPSLSPSAAAAAADRLAKAIDETGKVDAQAPSEVRTDIAGRETLILDTFALGPGRDALKEGKVLYDRAQPDQAIPSLEQAARLLAAGLAISTDTRDLHEALTLLGLANAGLGNVPAAKAAFRRSAVLDPTRQLDPVNYPPQIVSMYEEVRKAALGETQAKITINAPKGATAWLDGRQVLDTASDISIPAGDHYLMVRAETGEADFQALSLKPGEVKGVITTLRPRAVGQPAADGAGRSRQTRDLYRSIGQYVDRDPVLLAGILPNGQVALQIYAPASGNFSKALTADAGGDAVGAMNDLLPSLLGFLGENGDVKSDRVSPQVVSLDVSANPVLAQMLFDPQPVVVATSGPDVTTGPTEKKGAPWYLWAGIGAVVVGGGTTAGVLLATGGGDNGTIELGPIP